MIKIIFSITVGLYLISCNSNRVYEQNADIDKYWLADSTIQFDFDINNSLQDYNLYFNVRNGVNFPHSNLYFKYALKDSVGSTLEAELVNFNLFHPKSGYPLGNGVGDIFEHQYELLVKYQFPNNGKYQLSFQQYMRYDSLPEIYSVGYTIAKTVNQ